MYVRICACLCFAEKNESKETNHCKLRKLTFTTTKFHLYLQNFVVCLKEQFA
jgi:hypothetical protein